MLDVKTLVDVENGTQSRRIFWDREIYELEMERIFARSWLFLTHDSLIPEYGDFVVTRMGEDEVVVWRQKDGKVRVFLNQCTHRGMRLCMAEAGNSRGLSCGYHGWAFKPDGHLLSVPCEKSWGSVFDRCQWNLREVPLVDSHHGFIFGCMDAASPPLLDFLGDAAWYMDIWAGVPGGVELLGPPSRSIIEGNWKAPLENFIGDSYHAYWTHASALKAVTGMAPPQTMLAGAERGISVTSRCGHGLGVSYGNNTAPLLQALCPEMSEWMERRRLYVEQTMGDRAAHLACGHWDASLFPNVSYLSPLNVFKQWQPLGPDKTEVLTWAIAERNMPDEFKQRLKVAAHRNFGTAGMLESDDVDWFEYGTQPCKGFVTRQGRVTTQMGMGLEREEPGLPGVHSDFLSEMPQRGFYRFYADCLASPDWSTLDARSKDWKAATLAHTGATVGAGA